MNAIVKIEGAEPLLDSLYEIRIDKRWKEFPTEARIQLIAALAADKWSASRIGELFGTTRNAVIGFATRRKIQLNASSSPKAAAPNAARNKTRQVRFKAFFEAKRASMQDIPRPQPLKTDPVASVSEDVSPRFKPITKPTNVTDPVLYRETPTMVSPLAVGLMQCRMPLWDGGRPPYEQMFFCGAPTGSPKESYCPSCQRGLTKV